MKPAPFQYRVPEEVDEAVALLSEHGDDAKVLAGGQSLIPLLNFRLAAPAVLVDVNRAAGLSGLKVEDGRLLIGAATRQSHVERHPEVTSRLPLLVEALRHVGHPQIRNRGTFGGSLAHADPAAELPAVALALGATMVVRGSSGERRVAADEFFVGLFTTALEPDELLTAVELPIPVAGTGQAFGEVARRHGDYALAGLAATLRLDDDGTVADARLAFLGAGGRPLLARSAAALLVGEEPSDDVLEAAAAAVDDDIDPVGDIHASADYRGHLARVLLPRVVRRAVERARGARDAAVPSSPGDEVPGRDAGVAEPSPPGEREPEPDDGATRRRDGPARPRIPEGVEADGSEAVRMSLRVNGAAATHEVEGRLLLSDFLRHDLGLYGTHVGCEHGVCGACTVLLDGQPVRSCLMLAAQAHDAEITTVEALAPDGPGASGKPGTGKSREGGLHPLQEAFRECHGLQCGYCTPGFLMTLLPFLEANPDPSDAEIREAISGNLCRCTGYQNIVAAARRAARLLRDEDS